LKLDIRAASPTDESLLRSFFAQLSAEDLRYRFLSTVREVGRDRLLLMTDVDHCQMESLLAFSEGTLVGTAMLAADPTMTRAEVAIAVRSDHQRRGIGSCMMEQVTTLASQRGISTLESLERGLGFRTFEVREDPSLVLLRRNLNQES
jgi:N-acetylglutamate synthase-like GNAT family acetyltransferase